MNRGDHSESVVRDARDPELFLATLAEACAKTDWQVHSFCLMSNHFHLVIETPRQLGARHSRPSANKVRMLRRTVITCMSKRHQLQRDGLEAPIVSLWRHFLGNKSCIGSSHLMRA